MPDESPLFSALLDDPFDRTHRAVYADWLQERDDPRGEYLRLLLIRSTLAPWDPRRLDVLAQLRRLRPRVDRSWAALVDDFDGCVRAVQTIQLRIGRHQPAASYLETALSAQVEQDLLQRAGWEPPTEVGGPYRHADGRKAQEVVLGVEVPTEAEILRLACGLHQVGSNVLLTFGPWIVRYQRGHTSHSRASGYVQGQEQTLSFVTYSPVLFQFGLGAPWNATVSWSGGDAAPVLTTWEANRVG